ncbi:MAG: amino acid ABC transporter substrate-binding protein [Oceanospirillales bacterium]|nr:amino acid ABC transporter substrate-binding protein [Oceanospirillales bacterium]
MASPLLKADSTPTIKYQHTKSPNDKRDEYFLQLLKLALDESRVEYGDYHLQQASALTTQDRAFALVKAGQYIDVTWVMSSTARERDALAIPIPLLKGLLGYRTLLVANDRLKEFDAVDSLTQLAKFTAIQGTGWPDVDILRYNHLNVITSPDYESLFNMLRRHRADYFPRGISEVWLELNRPVSAEITLKTNLVLFYRSPIYFFVSRRNPQLAARIKRGLELAASNGRFDQLFYSRPEIRKAIELLEQREHRIVELELPWTLPSLQQVDPAHWYQHDNSAFSKMGRDALGN